MGTIVMSSDEVRDLLREIFDERERQSQIDREMHKEHHEFLKEVIPLMREDFEARQRRRELWDSVRKTAVGTIVVSIVGGMITFLAWIGDLVIKAVNHGAAQ